VRLVLRNLFWALLIPGIVTGDVPWRVLGADRTVFNPSLPWQFAGIAIVRRYLTGDHWPGAPFALFSDSDLWRDLVSRGLRDGGRL
jgi:hypothetical protein